MLISFRYSKIPDTHLRVWLGHEPKSQKNTLLLADTKMHPKRHAAASFTDIMHEIVLVISNYTLLFLCAKFFKKKAHLRKTSTNDGSLLIKMKIDYINKEYRQIYFNNSESNRVLPRKWSPQCNESLVAPEIN